MGETKLQDWQLIDWKYVEGDVRNLRQQIFVASQENDLNRVATLQKLMLRSRANWMSSIRRVTQINKGRRTPGVDREVITKPKERVKLFYWLEGQTINKWNPPPTRRIEIPKGPGKTRPLGIPTIRDRIIQAIVKNALEPFWEARFEGTSYGFRPGRSTHDAIEDVWLSLKGRRQWVLDADIKGAFDNIDHDKLMEIIGLFPARFLIRKWLKAGVMVNLDLSPTVAGTPQGGILSPLLANIALHGMEAVIGAKRTVKRNGGKGSTYYPHNKVIRYADDFVILTKTRAQAKEAKKRLEDWLAERGLTLSKEKTNIVNAQDGFDFLGFTIIRRKNAQSKKGFATHTLPSKKSTTKFKDKVRDIVHRNWHNPDKMLMELNPLIIGWANYFRSGVSSQTFGKLDHFMWHRIWRWALRRHPNKGKDWVKKRYYRKINDREWTFVTKTGARLRRLGEVKIRRHTKVVDLSSPDDPELTAYWIKRRRKLNFYIGVKAAVFDKQKGICEGCDGWLDDGEAVHLHHRDGNRENWKLSNLSLLHETCHHQITTKMRRTA
jgi:RNA-directed DNA polymerase